MSVLPPPFYNGSVSSSLGEWRLENIVARLPKDFFFFKILNHAILRSSL